MVEGTTKSGIKFKLDERVKDDARLLYLMTEMNKLDAESEPMKATDVAFSLFKLIFGSGDGLMDFMNAVADVHGGVCGTAQLMDELREMLEALNVKN